MVSDIVAIIPFLHRHTNTLTFLYSTVIKIKYAFKVISSSEKNAIFGNNYTNLHTEDQVKRVIPE